jgi:hypothetical protein
MRPICAFSAGVTLMLVASGTGWAGERKGEAGKDKEVSASLNKQFQWEEKVVGPHDKGVNHDKIAAMQEEGRRQDEARRQAQMSGHAPKAARTAGVNGPATARLPTMDIEKAAPAGSVRSPVRKAAYSPPPRPHDAIDDLLAEDRGSVGDDSGHAGLDRVLSKRARGAKHAKHARAR